ncbi:MAG: hypothetical protein ABIG42_02225, partial [bacterium]
MSLVLCCLSFIQCSKGDGVIAPIVTDEKNQFMPDISDSIYISTNEDTRIINSTEHPQVTPVMTGKSMSDMDEKLSDIIGRDTLLQDQLIFLYAKPEDTIETNPPLMNFSFVTPPNTVSPDDITVMMDGKDISRLVNYSLVNKNKRNADFFIGAYKPSIYLNPQKQHQFDIKIAPITGNTLHKHYDFNVPHPENLKVQFAGFERDETSNMIQLDKLKVSISAPGDVNFIDRLLDVNSWIVTNKGENPIPAIESISRKRNTIFIIHFSQKVKPLSKFDITFSPSTGVIADAFEVLTPYIPVDRGGGFFQRKGTSNCPPGCVGTITPNPILIVGCADFHTWSVDYVCPLTCYSTIEEDRVVVTYDFSTTNYLTDDSSANVQVNIDTFTDLPGGDCVASKPYTWDSREDIITDYVLIGHNPPPISAPCGEISPHAQVAVRS